MDILFLKTVHLYEIEKLFGAFFGPFGQAILLDLFLK